MRRRRTFWELDDAAGWAFSLLAVLLLYSGCDGRSTPRNDVGERLGSVEGPVPERIAETFALPVGPPRGAGYYDAQDFGVNDHLGEDWNAASGGNSDCGDGVFAVGDGLVVERWREESSATSGWGNALVVRHSLPNDRLVESFYAHLRDASVQVGDSVERGDRIAAMGDGDGSTSRGPEGHCDGEPYFVHLHFEIRTETGLGLGPGYSDDASGRAHPSEFVARRNGRNPWF